MIITLKKFSYVLDWYDIKDIEIDTDKFAYFVMQYRLGSWYLMHYAEEKGKIVNVYEHDFQLDSPWDAVEKIGNKIKRYENLHSDNITKHLINLFNRIDQSIKL